MLMFLCVLLCELTFRITIDYMDFLLIELPCIFYKKYGVSIGEGCFNNCHPPFVFLRTLSPVI